VLPTSSTSSVTMARSANDLSHDFSIEHLVWFIEGGHSQRGLPSTFFMHLGLMKTGPTQEPTLRADRSIDSALVTVVLALFVAAAFGLNELPGGAAEWVPKEWKGVHDCAKGLILPLLALRLGLSLHGEEGADHGLRNRIWVAMGLCWIGDIALTFSGDTAFLVGLVSFLLGHVVFIAAFRHVFRSGWGATTGWVRRAPDVVIGPVAISFVISVWGDAGDLAPAVAVYALIISLMATMSWQLAKGPGVYALRVGTTAFLVSDMLLALGRFTAPIAYGHFWVMGTYILAQWALAIGFTEVARNRAASRP